MPNPWVGVVPYRLAPGRVQGWVHGAAAVPEPYLAALRRAGLEAVLLPPGGVEPDARLLASIQGLVLIGGGDVEPHRYGAPRHEKVYGEDPLRDELEIALVRGARARHLPLFAICRGAQVANVALGGTLHQHLPDLPGAGLHGDPVTGGGVSHEVRVAEGSRLFAATGRTTLACWSRHHQGLDRLGEGLVAVGWSPDGLVEAVESEDGWLLAVQWHPEETADRDPDQQALFDAFAARVRARAGG
ncbi:MAG TPA: gamma-glutamyl-gamma-aminobutyrate hydrolase family protein [Actinomycetota bacterium]|nr:gamma-glutamyl-gamma-aminobutyrate hydrolase family protein [Actinomycetota bacterium]